VQLQGRWIPGVLDADQQTQRPTDSRRAFASIIAPCQGDAGTAFSTSILVGASRYL
jgi:hypothetical protein